MDAGKRIGDSYPELFPKEIPPHCSCQPPSGVAFRAH